MDVKKEIRLKNGAITRALNHNMYISEEKIKRIETCNDTYGCNNKFCYRCQKRRRARIFFTMKKLLAQRKKEYRSKKIKPMFLFVTIDTPNIEASGENIRKAILRIKQAYLGAKKEPEIIDILLGDFWAIDIANYKWSKYVMVHLHCLLAVKSSYHSKDYITKGRWLNLFQSVRDLSKMETSVNVKEVDVDDVPKVASYMVKVHKIFDEIMSKEESHYSLNLEYDVFNNMYNNLWRTILSGRSGYFTKNRINKT